MKKAGVIGGSGFIESDVIALLLQIHYDVKVSTSDISQNKNYQHLMELEGSENLHVCELDISSKSDLNSFIKDCDLIIYMRPSDLTI